MMRLSLIPFLLAVEPMLLILRRIEKKLWHDETSGQAI